MENEINTGQKPENTKLKSKDKKKFIVGFLVLVAVLLGGAVVSQNKDLGPGALANKFIDLSEEQYEIDEEKYKEKQLDLCRDLYVHIKAEDEQYIEEFQATLDDFSEDGENAGAWVVIGCSAEIYSEEFLAADIAGENEEKYREKADEYKALADSVNFDLYTTNYEMDNAAISGVYMIEATERYNPYQVISYAALHEGGHTNFGKSPSVARISIYGAEDDASYTGKCSSIVGPRVEATEREIERNSEDCTVFAESDKGTIYRSGVFNEYTVEDDGNVIFIYQMRQEYIVEFVNSLTKTPIDQIDFFTKPLGG